jgi:lipopolysaccharide transport system ATP-binding protein
MGEPMVSVERVGKRYRLTHEHAEPAANLRELITSTFTAPLRWLRSPAPSAPPAIEEFWALQDVSFEVAQGEVIGIIGRNGAGKSTLLKILSRITEPTAGRAVLRGRVASLLEVGTGFHPELSGRENVFLNAAILGMTRAEIARKFDEIVAFADVERFLDTPVKRYSSGMYVRLAFAVAAHLEPEILIVDEVLAVGDAEFQKKCLGKMHEVSRGGRTVLFVSHNLAAIQAHCSRVIYLDKGRLIGDGDVLEWTNRYRLSATQAMTPRLQKAVAIGTALELRAFELSPNPVTSGAAVTISLSIHAHAAVRVGELAVLVYSAQEARVALCDFRSAPLPALAAGQTWTGTGQIKTLPLVEGDYRIGLYVAAGDFLGDLYDLLELTVDPRAPEDGQAPYPAAWRGVLDVEFSATGVTGTP